LIPGADLAAEEKIFLNFKTEKLIFAFEVRARLKNVLEDTRTDLLRFEYRNAEAFKCNLRRFGLMNVTIKTNLA